MDPISAIVTAIAAGAAAATKDVAAETVKGAYKALKELVTRKYAAVDLVALVLQLSFHFRCM
jgi:hypothetical protein